MKNCKGIIGFLFGHKIVTAYDTVSTPIEPSKELRATIEVLKQAELGEKYDHLFPARVQSRIQKVISGKVEKKAVCTYCKRCGLVVENIKNQKT